MAQLSGNGVEGHWAATVARLGRDNVRGPHTLGGRTQKDFQRTWGRASAVSSSGGRLTAELLELILLHESVIDSQLQFWMTATFAIVVASFAARDVLTHRMRLIVSGLYLVATFVFASRWLYAVLDILVYATALSDIGITMLPAPWATIVGRIVLMSFGTLMTLYFVIVGSKRQAA